MVKLDDNRHAVDVVDQPETPPVYTGKGLAPGTDPALLGEIAQLQRRILMLESGPTGTNSERETKHDDHD